jgi:tetratricopeptide (TPR) repeat protein
LASYERALTLYLKTDRRPEAFVYDSFASLFQEQGQYEKAAEYLQRAIILCESNTAK